MTVEVDLKNVPDNVDDFLAKKPVTHMTCYVCNTGIDGNLQTQRLFDGRTVNVCVTCYDVIQQGIATFVKKHMLFEEEIHGNFPKSETYRNEMGGDNMEIPLPTGGDGTPFLGRKIVTEKGIKKVKILDEAVMVDTEYEGKPTGKKPQCKVETDVEDPKVCVWQMNKSTQKWAVEKFGADSRKWIGESFEIKVASAGTTQASVYPKELSLEKVY